MEAPEGSKARGGPEAPEGTQAPGGGQAVPHIIVDDEDSAPREGSAPVGPQEGEKASGAESEVPPQPVAPEGLGEYSPASGAGTGASVEASQVEATVVSPAPSAGEAEVRPKAPGAAGNPQGAPSSQKKSAPRASRKQKAPSVALAPLKPVKKGAQSTPGSARPMSPPPPSYEALKATSLEKSVFLRRERDAWASYENERAAREAAEGELTRECEISAELRQKCSALASEARKAREKVAPLEKRVGDLTQESEEQKAAAEGYKGEGYVLPDDETEAQEEVQRLEDAASVPGDALAAFFDDEVELPPLGVQGPGQTGQQDP
ncbi:myristoylated alanine-rich C-kinase substrate-like [Sorghum bicolor]|uniref:myristoylated alanine-rich C-kinase substrate-like n=1 Tax=Sorghum bicolor TaxID=4558 RepID=UPI000B424031|nr:myristoylated alanine-rich C-kinase substrate-like [Sorghum bicolor]|eukprot:XP_021303830.1 myristoylated alanine-rich C-kinase substrate-like [Sorghum bicolor]